MKVDITVKDVSIEDAVDVIAKLHCEMTATKEAPKVAPKLKKTKEQLAELDDEPSVAVNTVDLCDSELDAEGLPWDERIHSSNKKKKADGTWTARRNTDKALVEQVKQELRAAMAPPMPAGDGQVEVAPGVSITPQTPTHPTPAMVEPEPVEDTPAFLRREPTPEVAAPVEQVAALPQTGAPVEQTVPPPAHGDFNSLVMKAADLEKREGGPAYVQSVISHVGVQFGAQLASLTDMAANQPMINAALQKMSEDGV